VKGIEWIRLHYAFPTGFPLDVLDVMKKEPKICNYLDIPLQHIADPILASMKRGTTAEKTNKLIDLFKEKVPNITLRTTLIVGYPGETEKDFEQLRKWVEKTQFDRLGCFTYSHEENTTAYQLEDNVPPKIKQQRADEIMQIQSQISFQKNQQKIGKTFKCLIDRKEGDFFIGRTESDSPDIDNEVLVDAKKYYLKQGNFTNLKIIKANNFDLEAVPVEKKNKI